MPPSPGYPFTPKSNRRLEPGQFWSVPLSDGRFACGRVMAVPADFSPRVSFIAGLMAWVRDRPPSEDDLVGGRVIEQGSAHIKTITETGGQVLGARPLELDGLATANARELSTWGFQYIARRAEHLFRTTSG